MKNLLRYIAFTTAFALMASAGCSALSEPVPADSDAPSKIAYEYLYDCIWTVADLSESGAMPSVVADEDGALHFRENGEILLMRRRPDLEESTGRDRVYSTVSEGNYGLDRETRTLTISGEGGNCYFRIERLNDRTLTLYYRDDPNSYLAYNRCEPAYITVLE